MTQDISVTGSSNNLSQLSSDNFDYTSAESSQPEISQKSTTHQQLASENINFPSPSKTTTTTESSVSNSSKRTSRYPSFESTVEKVANKEGKFGLEMIGDSVPQNFSISSFTSSGVAQTTTPSVNELKLKLDEIMDCSLEQSSSISNDCDEHVSSINSVETNKCHFCDEILPDRVSLYQHKRYNCSKNPEVLLHQQAAYTSSISCQGFAQNQIDDDFSGKLEPGCVNASLGNQPITSVKFAQTSANQNAATPNQQNVERKKRTVYTDKQLETLRDCYLKQPNPNSDDIEKIANNIGLTKRNVQVWFQNKRARDKKNPGIFDYLDSTISGNSPTNSVGINPQSEIPPSGAAIKFQSKSPPVEQNEHSPLTPVLSTNQFSISNFSKSESSNVTTPPVKNEGMFGNASSNIGGNNGQNGENLMPALYSYQWLSFLSFYQAMAASNMLNAGLNPASLLQSQLASLALLNQLKTESSDQNLDSAEKSPSTKPSPVQSETGTEKMDQSELSTEKSSQSDVSIMEKTGPSECISEKSEDEPLDLSIVKTELDSSKTSETSPCSNAASDISAPNSTCTENTSNGTTDSLIMDLSNTLLPLMSPVNGHEATSTSSSPLSVPSGASSFFGGLVNSINAQFGNQEIHVTANRKGK